MDYGYKNKNRGCQQLRVWCDAVEFYVLTCRALRPFPYDLRRVASPGISSADSVHRNIAEGYCRRSLRKYLQFLNYALGSVGESVSGLIAYHKADQLADQEFAASNSLAFNIENGLLKLVESLERKETRRDWVDHLMLTVSNLAPDGQSEAHYSRTSPLQHPKFHGSHSN